MCALIGITAMAPWRFRRKSDPRRRVPSLAWQLIDVGKTQSARRRLNPSNRVDSRKNNGLLIISTQNGLGSAIREFGSCA